MYLQPYALALGAYSSVRSLLRGGFDFDLIDAHYFYPDGVAAALLARRFKKPVVITARGTDINLLPSYALPKSLILWAARQANAVITVSGALKRKLGGLGADANEIRVIRNGVDLQFFKPGPVDTARRTLHLPQGPLIASVGNLVAEKGHDLVIRALQLMPSVKLVIVGDGPERMRLASLASTARVNERVFFRPAMPQQDLADVYRSVDVLVLASSREGWPNVLLEAMACGTPVVAADVGGVREIVASVEAGIVLSERTPDGIASAVQDLLRVPRSRASVREYAERFGWGSVCSDLADLFSRVIERSQLAPIKRASAAV
jgi:glycosyltransferase involved in cell wall biosynthesis